VYALVGMAAKLMPEIVVIDIAMPQLNGLDATRQLKRKMPKVKTVIMTMKQDPDLVGEAFRARASAFLLKQAAAFGLIDAIYTVMRGASFVIPQRSKRAGGDFVART
jgi:DNA-binding NarL/FixJ family response regulator